jgi:hypothetical protein
LDIKNNGARSISFFINILFAGSTGEACKIHPLGVAFWSEAIFWIEGEDLFFRFEL